MATETTNIHLPLYEPEDYETLFVDYVNSISGNNAGTNADPFSAFQLIDLAIGALRERKVEREEGKGLSTNDFTNALKSDLEWIYKHETLTWDELQTELAKQDSPLKAFKLARIEQVQSAIREITDKIGQPNGIATLDENGNIPLSQVPSLDYLPYENGVVSDDVTFGGDVTFQGRIVNLDVETVQAKDYTIELAEGHSGALSSPAGIYADEVDGANGKSVGVFIGSDGVVRAGEVEIGNNGLVSDDTNLQAVATRDESSNLTTGDIAEWDGSKYVDSGIASSDVITKSKVDSSLSATSENPVQNKVVKTALDSKLDASKEVTASTSQVSGASMAQSITVAGVAYNLSKVTDADMDAKQDSLTAGTHISISNDNTISTDATRVVADTKSAGETLPLLNAVNIEGVKYEIRNETADALIDPHKAGQERRISFVTQAEYDALVENGEIRSDTFYNITDDTTISDLQTEITNLQERVPYLTLDETNGLTQTKEALLNKGANKDGSCTIPLYKRWNGELAIYFWDEFAIYMKTSEEDGGTKYPIFEGDIPLPNSRNWIGHIKVVWENGTLKISKTEETHTAISSDVLESILV